jgi:hypothetical protein
MKGTYYLVSDKVRENCIEAIHALGVDRDKPFRVSLSEPKHGDTQRKKMWAMLGEFSKQATLNGNQYSDEKWKLIFMRALGMELTMLPELHGSGFFPVSLSIKPLSVKQMSDMIELIYAEGAARGVVFKEPEQGRIS